MEIVLSFVTLLTGLSIFLVGIHQMSTGLEKISTKRMQKGLSDVSSNPVASFGFGTFITAIMQSSTLVTVMTITFLNANLLTLTQGIAIVLGANIGTTLTGLISSFATFDYAAFLALFTLVGVIIEMTAKKPTTKRIGQILIGFGLIFIGLSLASNSFKNDAMRMFIQSIFESISFPLLLIFASIIFTIIVNSSSVVVGLTIILVSTQTIPIEYALFVVLGAEVGTTSTGLLASLRGNANAKRLSFIQFVFNLLGCVLFALILWLFTEPIVRFIQIVDIGFQVSFFQIFFNVSTALIGLIFINHLEKLSYLVVKDTESNYEEKALIYVTERLLKTPAFALSALEKEVYRMFELVKENVQSSFDAINHQPSDIFQKVQENEDIIDYLNQAISLYLVKLSTERLDYRAELQIGKMYHVINDLERIGDHAHNFVTLIQEMKEENITFSKYAQEELKNFTTHIERMLDIAFSIYRLQKKYTLTELAQYEDTADTFKIELENNHVKRLRTGECLIEHSKYFFDFTSQLERIADHLTNIGYSTVSVVGDVK